MVGAADSDLTAPAIRQAGRHGAGRLHLSRVRHSWSRVSTAVIARDRTVHLDGADEHRYALVFVLDRYFRVRSIGYGDLLVNKPRSPALSSSNRSSNVNKGTGTEVIRALRAIAAFLRALMTALLYAQSDVLAFASRAFTRDDLPETNKPGAYWARKSPKEKGDCE
jgi:hypothetical protein